MEHQFDTPCYKPKSKYHSSIHSNDIISQLISPFHPSFLEKNICAKKSSLSSQEPMQEYDESYLYEDNEQEFCVVKISRNSKKPCFEPKRCRGRPRKQKQAPSINIQTPKKKRGRPKKIRQESEISNKNKKKTFKTLASQTESLIYYQKKCETLKNKVEQIFQEEDQQSEKDEQILNVENLANQSKTSSKKPRKKQNGFIKQVTIQLIQILMHFPNGGNLKEVAELVYQMYHKQQTGKEQCHKQFLNIKRRIYEIAKILHHIGMLQKVSKTEQEKYKSNFMIDMDMLTHNIRKLVICHINNSKYSFIIKIIKQTVMFSTQFFSTTRRQIILFKYKHSGMYVLINQAKDCLKILERQGSSFLCLKTFDLSPFLEIHTQETQRKKYTKAPHKQFKQQAMLSQILQQEFQESLLHEQNEWQNTYVKVEQKMQNESSINEEEMFNQSDYEELKIDPKQQHQTFAKFRNLQFKFRWNSQLIKKPSTDQHELTTPKLQDIAHSPRTEQFCFQKNFSFDESNCENENPIESLQQVYDQQMSMDMQQLQMHSVNSVSSHQEESNTPHSIGSTRQTSFFPNIQINFWDKNYFR